MATSNFTNNSDPKSLVQRTLPSTPNPKTERPIISLLYPNKPNRRRYVLFLFIPISITCRYFLNFRKIATAGYWWRRKAKVESCVCRVCGLCSARFKAFICLGKLIGKINKKRKFQKSDTGWEYEMRMLMVLMRRHRLPSYTLFYAVCASLFSAMMDYSVFL